MSVDDYLAAEQQNMNQMRKMQHFRELIPLLDSIYVETFGLVPKDSLPHYGRLLLVCHKSFLGAASLLLRLQPADAASVTRRACEAALLAAAIKDDKKNLREWQAFETRTKRWDTRREGKKPKGFWPKIQYPKDDEKVEWLLYQLGALSDAYVHFTPEFMLNLDWRVEGVAGDNKKASVNLNYFTNDPRQIEGELLNLAKVHATALAIFDDCYDGVFKKGGRWASLLKLLQVRGFRLAKRSAPPGPNLDKKENR